MPNPAQKLAYSIDEVTKLTGVGRSFIYEEIKDGRLLVRKAGRRTLIFEGDLNTWLAELPAKYSGSSKQPRKPKITK